MARLNGNGNGNGNGTHGLPPPMAPALVSERSSRNASPLRPGFTGVVGSYKAENMVVANELHPVISAGRVAVITGAASGIGKAAALELAK